MAIGWQEKEERKPSRTRSEIMLLICFRNQPRDNNNEMKKKRLKKLRAGNVRHKLIIQRIGFNIKKSLISIVCTRKEKCRARH